MPWNHPLLLMAWQVAPALAAGNTVVIKPSELTPLATLEFARIVSDHLPPGVINVVTGFGSEAGEPLVTHPQVPVIAPDIEIDVAVRALSYAALLTTGQVCTSTERVYVHESLYPQFSEELAGFVSSLKLGDGADPGTDIGPMIRERMRDRVIEHITQATEAGARLLTGGRIPESLQAGYFFEPAVLAQVDHSMRLVREETFGPVIPLMPHRTFDQAVVLANDSPYGLGATLMTYDLSLVKRFYEEVQAGTIWINDPLTDNFAGHFGGMKMSGQGRELGQEGFDEFCQVKHVHWDIEDGIKDYWYPYSNPSEGSGG